VSGRLNEGLSRVSDRTKRYDSNALPREISARTPLRVPKGHLQAIGFIAHQWTLIDLVLERLCVMFLQLPQAEGRLVFGRMDTLRKLEILDVMVTYRLPAGACKATAIDFFKRSRELNVKRNGVVHGRWVESVDDPGTILHYSLTGKPHKRLLPETKAQTADDLMKLAGEIREQVFCGQALLKAVPHTLLPLIDKSQ
jgi:hypothetical protein